MAESSGGAGAAGRARRAQGAGEHPLAFPQSWLWAGLLWWVGTGSAALVVVGTVRTSLPYMVRLVLVAGLSTIPALGLSRLLVRRSFPSVRPLWWLWLYALRCFFVYGYVTAFVLIAHWLERFPPGARPWTTTTWLVTAFGLAAAVAWGLVVRDTRRHRLGDRDRSELVIDLVMGAVAISGPVALVVNRLHRVPLHVVSATLVVLRPVDGVFGVAAGVFWCACLVRVVRDTAGLRGLSVDGIDMVAAVVALGGPPLLAVAPVVARHGPVQWVTVPLVFLATVLPGMVCAGVILLARVPEGVRRSTGAWVSALLVVSTVDAWCQLAMALSRYRLPPVPFILVAVVNFGFFLLLPLSERQQPVLGLDRLPPEAQLRRWDLVPAVIGLGAVALTAELLVGPGPGSPEGLAAVGLLGALVVLGAVRHYATIGEARRLHRRIRSMTDELYQQSRVDPLTGLFNRRALAERFPQLAASCARAGRPLSVAMVDLDHFKRFNDEHGHVAGDQLLRQLAARLRGVLRHEDVAARFGGEEFCLVLPGAEAHQVVTLLDRLRAAMEDRSAPDPSDGQSWAFGGRRRAHPWPVDARGPVITFSAGVAGWQGGEGFEDVVRRADAACYAAKAAGRDRVVVDATAGTRRSAGDAAATPGSDPAEPPGSDASGSPGSETAGPSAAVRVVPGGLSVERAMAVADALVSEALATPQARGKVAPPPPPA